MSIKEAFNRESTFEGAKEMPVRYSFLTEYRQRMLNEQHIKGTRALIEAGIPEMIDELAEIIRPEFPDVRTQNVDFYRKVEGLDKRFHYDGDGTVQAMLGWDFKKGPTQEMGLTLEDAVGNKSVQNFSFEGRDQHKSLSVAVFAGNQDIIIENWSQTGRQGLVIPRSIWTTQDGKRVVEDAIVLAYQNPKIVNDEPTQILAVR